MPLPSHFDKHRATVRETYDFCSPYRLGLAVGIAGDDLPSPYASEKFTRAYDEGCVIGIDRRHHFRRDLSDDLWAWLRSAVPHGVSVVHPEVSRTHSPIPKEGDGS